VIVSVVDIDVTVLTMSTGPSAQDQ